MKKKLVKDLLRVIKRLSINHTMAGYNLHDFWEMIKKVEKKGLSQLTRREKVALSEYFELRYYQGKVMAYLWVLYQLVGEKKAVELLLKGIKGEKNYDKYGKRIKK